MLAPQKTKLVSDDSASEIALKATLKTNMQFSYCLQLFTEIS